MRPLGFESPAQRLRRSLAVALVAGVGAVTLTLALIAFASRPIAPPAALSVLVAAFGVGFFTGLGLALTWPDFAPPQPGDDGDAEAGVPARLVPPVPTLGAGTPPEAQARQGRGSP